MKHDDGSFRQCEHRMCIRVVHNLLQGLASPHVMSSFIMHVHNIINTIRQHVTTPNLVTALPRLTNSIISCHTPMYSYYRDGHPIGWMQYKQYRNRT